MMDNPNSLHFLGPQTLKSEEEYIEAVESLCDQALRYVYIKARIAPKLLSHEDTLSALSKFVRRSRHSFCYILLDEPEWLMKDDSALLRLSRRLSEKVIIKKFEDETEEEFGCAILNDDSSIIYMPADHRAAGFSSMSDRPNQKSLREQFIKQWQQSSIATSLRTLSGL